MYPVTLGFDEAVKRINALLKNRHHAEALVTSVFTLEKLMRRSMRLAAYSRGFTSKQADILLDRKGFKDLQILWPVYDRLHRALPELIGNKDWQFVPKAVEMRNKLVHGMRVYDLAECKEFAQHTLKALRILHTTITGDYGHDPWTKLKAQKKPAMNWVGRT